MQLKITLKDGSIKTYPKGITGLEIAQSISPSLAKRVVAVKVNDREIDSYIPIEEDAKLELITADTKDGLEVLRHDMAHILADAVKELYPETQVTIGPNIEDGFYYDFYREQSFTPDDLPKIEAKMQAIIAKNTFIQRQVWQRKQAIEFFKSIGEDFKAQIIQDLPSSEDISVYKQGEFIDLCRGPHSPRTGTWVNAGFKLTKIAGSYWRGDQNNAKLQRIYGTAWATKKELEDYLNFLEEAKKRDHRLLGQQLDLFHMQEEAVGQVFWHANGWFLYRTLENYIREKLIQNNYIEVKTPQILDRVLWEKSGHWEKFGHYMFSLESEGKTLAIKPMSCPGHIQIFNQKTVSYKQLPIRMAEFGNCHRNEPSGSLHGIMRVRGFTQDDAHIFCTEDQIFDETKNFCKLLYEVYSELGFNKIAVKISLRPEKRAGDDATWDRAEESLKQATTAAGLDYELLEGEGAFYGPKLEFHLTDVLGRTWQCGTLQLDFVLPQRLEANYIGADNKKHTPVMIHRAILGSLERFIGILIEHYAGKFPLWLAPIQIAVLTVTNAVDDFAFALEKTLKNEGFRVVLDNSHEKISYKVREYSLQKIPYLFVIGEKEAAENSVTIRKIGSNEQKKYGVDEIIDLLKDEVASKVVL